MSILFLAAVIIISNMAIVETCAKTKVHIEFAKKHSFVAH